MSDLQQQTTNDQVEASLEQIGDFDNLFEPSAAQRDDAGRFSKAEPASKAESEPDAKEPDGAAQADEAEEDYIELAAEAEGAEPTRLKLSEVMDGYKRSKELASKAEEYERQLSELRRQVPADVETRMVEAVQARQRYIAGLQQLEQWMQPRWPSQELLNEQSAHYNPQAYRQQYEAAQQVAQLRQNMQAEAERVAAENSEVSRTIQESRAAREWTEALKVWPEIKEQTLRREVKSWLQKEGYDDDSISRISSRDLGILKRAYLYDKAQVAKETTAKVVKATPKLVRPQARQSTGAGRSANATQAMERLGKTGSFDDAVAALENIL